jgi:hypothetical protein
MVVEEAMLRCIRINLSSQFILYLETKSRAVIKILSVAHLVTTGVSHQEDLLARLARWLNHDPWGGQGQDYQRYLQLLALDEPWEW